jgi:alginate O-acetyltransferase complex protein AlgI
MLFNSFAFLIFLPVFVLIYFNTKGSVRLGLCLVGSYIFYGWWDWRFLILIAGSTVMDWSIALWLDRLQDPQARRRLMFASVVVNLGVLAIFKYFNFFIDSLSQGSALIGLGLDFPLANILLPVGISFYTFQSMSYTIDVYRGEIPVEKSLLRFATFVAFFPQLVAGPIVRAADLLPQLRKDHPLDAERFISGMHLMLWGFFKKIVVADSLAAIVESRFELPGAHSSASLAVGLFFYAMQIYCDFSGYSDIAIGCARLLGFDFLENFRRPYFSRSFSEFWTRWHISLSSWLRDYLYIPLGGNRGGTLFTYRNLMITMLLGGLWHGANWTFVLWGALHGTYLIIQRLASPGYNRIIEMLHVPRIVNNAVLTLLVFSATCFAWVFFRAPNFEVAIDYLQGLAGGNGARGMPQMFQVVKGFGVIAILLSADAIMETGIHVRSAPAAQRLRLATSVAVLILLALFGTFGSAQFIYFQF